MFLTFQNKRIHYEVRGNGFPLLMLHGNGENLHIFDKASELLKEKYRVYTLDLPGHGESYTPQQLHYEDQAQDVLAFIRALGLERTVLYGFSDGGIIGLILAVREPKLLSSLIVSGANLTPEGLRLPVRWGMQLRYLFGKSDRVRMMLKEPNLAPEELEQIQIPTYVTAGQFDCVRPSHTRLIAAHIPGARLKIFKGQFHGSYVTYSGKIGEYILGLQEDSG